MNRHCHGCTHPDSTPCEGVTFPDCRHNANNCDCVAQTKRENYAKQRIVVLENQVRNLTSDSIILEMDGDAWCAKRRNFSNIQESDCGFGETPTSAVDDLFKVESQR